MLIQTLTDKGFHEAATAGGCRVMVRRRGDKTDVISSTDGDLPDDDDWLFVIYHGDWLSDPDADEVDCIDHESSPMHLLQLIDL